MPFDDAKEFTSFVDDGFYYAQCVNIEDGEEGQFGPSIRWVFHLKSQDTGEMVLIPEGDNAGQIYEFYAFTSTKMTPKAKARKWSEVLLGREIEVGESGSAIANECIGKSALVLIEANEAGYPRIENLTAIPKKGKQKAAPTPEPEPAPEPVAAGVAPTAEDFDPFAED